MNILLLGSGGREHALAWKICQSSRCKKLFVAPGNAGTATIAENVNIAVDDFQGLGTFALSNHIDMIIVGPEDPLVKGIADYFEANDQLKSIPVIGPSAKAALLEGSKDFAKAFMLRHHIPTARHKSVTFKLISEGTKFLDSLKPPYVLKADGLAAGKGVVIVNNLNEAKEELHDMLQGKFGEAGKTVVIE
jgi:phosphoribosylamine--glycine ligase